MTSVARPLRRDAATRRPLRRRRRRHARPGRARGAADPRPCGRRLRSALARDLHPFRRRRPGGHDRPGRPAVAVGRARRRCPGGARDRAHLPLDRRAPGRRLPHHRVGRRPRARLPRAGGRARRRGRLRRAHRDRRARPRRRHGLPRRARRQLPRADGARHQRRWSARRAADALAAHLACPGRRLRTVRGARRAGGDRRAALHDRPRLGAARHRRRRRRPAAADDPTATTTKAPATGRPASRA